MIDFEVSVLRSLHKELAPMADFDSQFTFYYDETNTLFLRKGRAFQLFNAKGTHFNSSICVNSGQNFGLCQTSLELDPNGG